MACRDLRTCLRARLPPGMARDACSWDFSMRRRSGLAWEAGRVCEQPWPLALNDHPLHFHGAVSARRFFALSGTNAGYDPAFMAGICRELDLEHLDDAGRCGGRAVRFERPGFRLQALCLRLRRGGSVVAGGGWLALAVACLGDPASRCCST